MTEYDFSPEAQDRYKATMRRISRWVDDTEAHKGEFRCAVETDPRELVDDGSGSGRRRTARDLGRDLPGPSSSSHRRGVSLDARAGAQAIYAPLPGPMPGHYLSATRHPTPAIYSTPHVSSATPVYAPTPTPAPVSAHRPPPPTPTPVPVYVPPQSGYLHAPAPQYAASPVPLWSQTPEHHYHSAPLSHQHHHNHHHNPYLPGPTPYVIVPPPGALNLRVVHV